ncbi:MAG: hypothetical protein MZV70_45955 [Desulfobacterales bacterium]|nr:hypothetical protein [Desulfobacterales bacterium]
MPAPGNPLEGEEFQRFVRRDGRGHRRPPRTQKTRPVIRGCRGRRIRSSRRRGSICHEDMSENMALSWQRFLRSWCLPPAATSARRLRQPDPDCRGERNKAAAEATRNLGEAYLAGGNLHGGPAGAEKGRRPRPGGPHHPVRHRARLLLPRALRPGDPAL